MLDAVGRPKIRDIVATRLKSYISDGNLKPGDRLPTETELATRFGVSRLSLREATKSLEFLGILESRPGRGLSVGRIKMDRVTEFLGFHPALHDVPPMELIETRVVIEAGALPRVADRMKQDRTIYEALDGSNARLRRARGLQRRVELDIAFHRGLIAASGLSPLLAFGDVLAVFFRRFHESLKKAQWEAGIEGHQRIIDALRDGRVPEADRELRAHIESHCERLETA